MKIASTSGCFSLLHAGHVWLFQQMRDTVGQDGLVLVLINDDAYLQRAKGRVLVPLKERIAILRGLKNIDAVIPFKEDDPCRLIWCLHPAYWFKGEEYLNVDIPETEVVKSYGGEVIFPHGGPAVHTSDIIGRIRKP